MRNLTIKVLKNKVYKLGMNVGPPSLFVVPAIIGTLLYIPFLRRSRGRSGKYPPGPSTWVTGPNVKLPI